MHEPTFGLTRNGTSRSARSRAARGAGGRMRARQWGKGLVGAAVMLATLAWAAAPAPAPGALTVRDDRDHVQSFAAAPRRIVSLLPSLTESVCVLGGCDRLVGTDRYSNWPEAVRNLPKVGSLEDSSLERIAALRPAVVLSSPSARINARLESLGIAVLVFESKTHADVRRSLQQLAALLGNPAAGDAVWLSIERELARAAEQVPVALRGQRVYFEVDATPYAAGESSFIGQTLTRLGLANTVPASLGPFPKLNPEFVVRAQPDLVMAVQRNLDEMPRRPGWGRLVALRENRTCGFDSERYEVLVRPGPRLGEAALQLAACLALLGSRQP